MQIIIFKTGHAILTPTFTLFYTKCIAIKNLKNIRMRTNLLLLCALTVFSFNQSFAQVEEQTDDKKFSVDLSADFVSRYVWRGINLSESPSVQPNLAFSFKGLSLGTWASYSFAREAFQEVDLFLTYETKHLTFTVNDYFNPLDSVGTMGDYFQIKDKTTRHTLEGMVTLTGSDNFPISFTTGVLFYGNDKDEDGKNLYSTYFELSYAAKIQEMEVTPFIGFTPAKGYYAEKANFVNIGVSVVKNIEISDKFQLPLNASFIVNPELEKVYFVIGITL